MLKENQQLSNLVEELINRFKNSITVQIIDPQSLAGIFKSIRYRVRKYPTFIIDDKEVVVGWDRVAIESALETCSLSRDN